MKDSRWIDALDAARECVTQFQTAGRLLAAGGFEKTGDDGYRNRTSFFYAMQSGHTAFEDALLRVLDIIDEQPPTGADWHQTLITRTAKPLPGRRPAILDDELAAAARETRSFRHLVVHGYRIDFRPDRAQPAMRAGLLLAARIEHAIKAFAEAIDPD